MSVERGNTAGPLELSSEAMRTMGYAAVDMLVARLAGLDERPAWQGATRQEMRDRLTGSRPDTPTDFPALLEELAERVFPYAGSIDHPRFMAFIPSCPTWPGVLGDLLASGFNVFQGTWIESAGPSSVELEVLGWFRDWIGYPPSSAGLLLSGGSVANLTALATARLARAREDWSDAVVYVSDETHSSMERAARMLGFPAERVRRLGTDRAYRLEPTRVAEAMAEDRSRGLRPLVLVANAGATSTGAVDPLQELADVCERQGAWLHVDGAYGGFAVLTERGEALLRGLDRADSITLDPHKWLFQPYEAGCLLVRDGRALEDAYRIMPSYLQDTELTRHDAPDAGEVNFADRGPQLTRSFRALKIWLSLRYFGLDRFREAIDAGMTLAERAEARIRSSSKLELLTPAALGVVCFRAPGGDAENEERVRRLAESGVGMISSTRIRGQYALRICIMNHRTRWRDVDAVITHLEQPVP